MRFVRDVLLHYRVKKQVRRLEGYLKREHPAVYSGGFLRAKAAAKQLLFRWAAGGQTIKGLDWPIQYAGPGKCGDLVSVIVPNYNHAQYLRDRLDSIYQQTYSSIEVILLDDCSTDESRDILEEYARRYPAITCCAFNEKNSGRVFAQWEKGLELAKGSLIWIAESDDWCDRDFLEKLLPAFRDESVMLAFARSDFMQDGQRISSTEQYLQDIPSLPWNRSFAITAHDLVSEGFSIKNVVPNVSSAIFRAPGEISERVKSYWQNMQLCGDWLFYLDMIRGGVVYYCHETTNYYRIQEKSTSLRIQGTASYYSEHEQIARYTAQMYRVPFTCHERHLASLEEHYLAFGNGTDASEVKAWFSLEKIRAAGRQRKPNVIMSVFSMAMGGGETFPIYLANEMKAEGIPVTVLDFQMDEDSPKVRQMLRPDVPCICLKRVAGLQAVLDHFSVDIIHSHHASVDEAVSYVVERGRSAAHHVISLHGMYEAVEPCYAKLLLSRVGRSCSAFVYTADKNLGAFKKGNFPYMDRFTKIGNGLPLCPIVPVPRTDLGISEDAFVLCLVSRGIPEKGWQPAIAAVQLARRQSQRDIELVIIGSGEMYDRLAGQVPAYVHLLGARPNIRDYFAMADMGLLPSEFSGESFPLVIIDCLFAGQPMLVSRLGESENELLDEEGQPAGAAFDLIEGRVPVEVLAALVVKAATDRVFYDKMKSRVVSASQKFYIETVVGKYLEVYERVIFEYAQ